MRREPEAASVSRAPAPSEASHRLSDFELPDSPSLAGTDAIAVIGLSGRFPGAGDVEELWSNLCQGVESISRFTAEELKAAGVDPALLENPLYVPAVGLLEDADRFDAPLFQITPREAELLDPQHRAFLETAWAALEDAGYDPARFPGAIGVFAGVSLNQYLLGNLLPSGELAGQWTQGLLASDKDFVTTRVSYKLNLRGPSLNVQSACSTSLVAAVLACQSLLSYQCDLAIAGGAAVRPQKEGYLYQEGGILSPDGHCRPFDAAARGTVPGNGVGAVVLKRLDEALADGDTVHAVIRGAALNNDGSAKVGFTAPSVGGQAEVVGMALAIAGISPRDITYIETHGTATPMGDPIEVRALDRVYRAETGDRGFCALGSLKSNLGHLDAAAGVTSLIKAVLALENKKIPPTLHFERPNPELDLENGPFYVNATTQRWETDRLPRRAGVSSFGIGGTNAHMVLEEAPPRPEEPAPEDAEETAAELLVLSARTPAALDALAGRLAGHLRKHPELRLADVAHTLRLGRRQLDVRRAVVAHGLEDAAAVLEGADPERVMTAEKPAGDREVVFLFPGQGAQHTGMATDLYRREPVFRTEVDRCSEILLPHLGFDLRRWLVPSAEDEEEAGRRLDETEITQPALFTVEYALAKLWMSWGIRPAAMLGHSLGEYVAACLADVVMLEDALGLVALRGRLVRSLAPGAMLSVSLPEEELAPLLEAGVEIAAVNAPGRTVASGPPEAVERLRSALEMRGVEARPLAVRHAFHSPSVEPILEEWADTVRQVPLAPPDVPYLSNLTGTWITAAQATDPAYWAAHLRQPVRFSAAVAELLSDPRRVLLEVGPGQTLTALARRHAAPGERRTFVASLPHRDDESPANDHLLGALGRLWLAGVEVDWQALTDAKPLRRIPLPTYPFERQRYWIEPRTEPQQKAVEAAPVPGSGLRAPLWKQALPPAPAADDKAAWLLFMESTGLGPLLAQRLREEKKPVAAVVAGAGWAKLSDGAYTLDPARPGDYDALLDEAGRSLLEGDRPLRIVHLWGLGSGQSVSDLARLAAAIGRRNPSRPVRLDVVTRGAAVLDGRPADLERAAVLGVCEAISAGTGGISCRAIDVVPPASDTETQRLAGQLLAELTSTTSDSAVAYRGRQRWIEGWETVTPQPLLDTGEGGGALSRAPARGRDGEGSSGAGREEDPSPTLPRFAGEGATTRRKPGLWVIAGDLAESAALAGALVVQPGTEIVQIGAEEPPPLAAGVPAAGLSPTEEWMARTEKELIERLPPEGAARVAAATDPLCASHILYFLKAAGVPAAAGQSTSFAAIRERLSLLPKYERFLRLLLQILEEDGIARVDGESVRFLRDAEEVGSPEEWRRRLEAKFPQLAGMCELLDHCVGSYPRALAGEIGGLAVLYPDGSPELLQRAAPSEEGATGEDFSGSLLREVLTAALEKLAPDETLRILEVGAGQGLLTRHLLPALAGLPPGRVEYHFTDLGRSFVLRAEREAAEAGRTYFRFGVLDISRDPEEQGYPLQSFHAVFGANVVHATPRIAETLANLRSLLVPGGILGLVEVVRQQRWAHMVWGLTDGWWSFDDLELRTTSPLLEPGVWKEVLGRTGFEGAEAYPREGLARRDTDVALLLAHRSSASEPAAAGRSRFLCADPADREALQAALAEARKQGPVRGAVYAVGATVWEDGLPVSLQSARTFSEALAETSPGVLAFVSGSPGARPVLAALAESWMDEGRGASLAVQWDSAEPPARREIEAVAAALRQASEGTVPAQLAILRERGRERGRSAPELPDRVASEAPDAAPASSAPAAIHDRPSLLNPYVAPRNETEETVVEIWRKALGIDRIGVHDNFMELGGDSLVGLQVTHAVMTDFELAGRSFSLYEYPTVAAIAGFLAEGQGESAPIDQRSSRGERRRELRKSLKRTSR